MVTYLSFIVTHNRNATSAVGHENRISDLLVTSQTLTTRPQMPLYWQKNDVVMRGQKTCDISQSHIAFS